MERKRKRNTFSTEEKLKLLEDYEQSGMKTQEFCTEHQLSIHSFRKWRQAARIAETKYERAFVHVQLGGSLIKREPMVLCYGRYEIKVPMHYEPDELGDCLMCWSPEMFIDLNTVRVYVKPGVTDMRKAVNGLSLIVSESMELDVLSGSLFLFCNRDRKLIKAIYWDGTGFWMFLKRLEKHRVPWPKSREAAREITEEQLKMLLAGINFWDAHKRLPYDHVV